MSALRFLVLVCALNLAAPDPTLAQGPWVQPSFQPGYNEGFQRGQRSGIDDHRRGNGFQFADERDYRRADIGYRAQYGHRDRYREAFRHGFQDGYRAAYRGPTRGGLPPWSGGPGRGNGRTSIAYQAGLNDGYEAGLDDGRDERRFDPVRERRYRNADRGYEREYGPKDIYKNHYREAFKQGYGHGYADGRRYDQPSEWSGFLGFRF